MIEFITYNFGLFVMFAIIAGWIELYSLLKEAEIRKAVLHADQVIIGDAA